MKSLQQITMQSPAPRVREGRKRHSLSGELVDAIGRLNKFLSIQQRERTTRRSQLGLVPRKRTVRRRSPRRRRTVSELECRMCLSSHFPHRNRKQPRLGYTMKSTRICNHSSCKWTKETTSNDANTLTLWSVHTAVFNPLVIQERFDAYC